MIVVLVVITERERETDAQLFHLKQLKASGFRMFLDDCGIGVISHLDTVKINRSILYFRPMGVDERFEIMERSSLTEDDV